MKRIFITLFVLLTLSSNVLANEMPPPPTPDPPPVVQPPVDPGPTLPGGGDGDTDGTEEWVMSLVENNSKVFVLPYGQRFGCAAANFFRLVHDV